jgi:hypothetical protein
VWEGTKERLIYLFLNAGGTHQPKKFNNVSNNSLIYDDPLSNKKKMFKPIVP